LSSIWRVKAVEVAVAVAVNDHVDVHVDVNGDGDVLRRGLAELLPRRRLPS
jgi:hypothetical protein